VRDLTLRQILKPLIAGLAILSLMLQVCLVALQLSILIASKAGAVDAALTVICTDHGAVAPPTEETPSDRRSDCGSCPLCGHAGASIFAVLPGPATDLAFAPGRALAFDFDHDLHFVRFLIRPQSRGPPASA
jgi:DUF2946 family protein